MAKFEESDPRWIVQDRADGTNVHNWHWKEQDCLPWAKQTLQDKFAAVQLFDCEDGALTATTDGLESVTGEAFTNIRKNKIIPSYELEIKIGWKGEVKSGSDKNVGSAKGWFHVPYLADENADEKPDVRVAVDGTSKPGPGSCLRQAILVQGLPKIHRILAEFVKELSAGGPNKDVSDTPMMTNTSATNMQSTPVPKVEQKKSSPQVKPNINSSKASLTIRQEFYASPRDIYECFINPSKFQAFAMSPAKIEPQPGGEFSWFGGSISGRFKELQADKQIVMDWRFNNWSEGCYSKVSLDISSKQEGSTIVKLTQENIPEQDQYGNENVREVTENGWQQQIFNRIRAVFGYGL